MESKNENTPLLAKVKKGRFGKFRTDIARKCLNWTPVEVLVVLQTVAVVIIGIVQSYYVINETALKYGQSHIIRHSDSSCNPSNNSNSSHAYNTSIIIQKEATQTLMYLGFCSTFGSVIPIFLIGYMTDYIGRQKVWIISVTGFIFQEILLLTTVLLRLPLWILYIGVLVIAFTGTHGGAMVAIFATVATITTPGKSRAFRITVVQGIGMLTAAVTNYALGFWIWTEKYYEPLILALCCSVLAVVLSLFILKPTPLILEFKMKDIIAPFKVYTKKVFPARRGKLLLCLVIFLLSSSCLIGKLEYQTLYLMHKPVCWNELKIQIMHGVQTLVNTVCVIGVVRLLLRFTQDIVILIFGSISGLISMLIFGLSVKGWMVYLHVLFGFVSIAVFPVLRAIMSRLVEPTEQGPLFASIACLDELTAALSGLVYGKLYTWSVSWFHGFVFLVMSGIFCLTLTGSLILFKWMRNTSHNMSINKSENDRLYPSDQ